MFSLPLTISYILSRHRMVKLCKNKKITCQVYPFSVRHDTQWLASAPRHNEFSVASPPSSPSTTPLLSSPSSLLLTYCSRTKRFSSSLFCTLFNSFRLACYCWSWNEKIFVFAIWTNVALSHRLSGALQCMNQVYMCNE